MKYWYSQQTYADGRGPEFFHSRFRMVNDEHWVYAIYRPTEKKLTIIIQVPMSSFDNSIKTLSFNAETLEEANTFCKNLVSKMYQFKTDDKITQEWLKDSTV
ncbi:MAG: hypothetical protein Q7R33_04770 [Nitrosarchaeum sp.]|nr:hypothetical protein [Nitrosarchaeum sp.]